MTVVIGYVCMVALKKCLYGKTFTNFLWIQIYEINYRKTSWEIGNCKGKQKMKKEK